MLFVSHFGVFFENQIMMAHKKGPREDFKNFGPFQLKFGGWEDDGGKKKADNH